MKTKPILFNGEMVRAVLDGRKTQTRRICKMTDDGRLILRRHRIGNFKTVCCTHMGDTGPLWSPAGGDPLQPMPKEEYAKYCPYGKPGSKIWVRETFAQSSLGCYVYRANGNDFPGVKWKPSIFMPRAASRITLEITDVRVERVQDITAIDAAAEGVIGKDTTVCFLTVELFHKLWDSINSKRKDKHGNLMPYSWDDNCWVWVVVFKLLKG